MKEQLQLLLKLQALDLERDKIHSEQDEIDDRLEEFHKVLGNLRRDLAVQQHQLAETEELQKDKKEELAEVERRYKDSKARLAKVSNTKEYSAIELEIENVKRQSAQLEEELIQLIEAIEATRTSVTDKQSKIKTLEATVEDESKRATTKLAELDTRLGKLTTERDTAASGVANDVRRRYDFIRSRREGLAVVAGRNGSCQGCFMALPPQLYNELQRGTSMHFCPSCQRILFFEDMLEAASQ